MFWAFPYIAGTAIGAFYTKLITGLAVTSVIYWLLSCNIWSPGVILDTWFIYKPLGYLAVRSPFLSMVWAVHFEAKDLWIEVDYGFSLSAFECALSTTWISCDVTYYFTIGYALLTYDLEILVDVWVTTFNYGHEIKFFNLKMINWEL